MNAATAEPEIIESQVGVSLVSDADVDIQVSTARRFPRSITTFMRKAQEMATLTPEIATACIYAIPRDGKTVEGPSARFAELVMNAWGNMRAEGKTLGDDGQYVTARGVAWDLESNTAIGYEIKRRITNRKGETFSADMITVTGNAGSSIALRNAILKAIPTPFWKPIYNACRKVVAGDVKTFASRRDNMMHEFAVMGVTEARLCAALGLKGKLDITLEHMTTLGGFYTALKDGDTTIEEAFPESGGLSAAPQPAQRKSQQSQPPVTATAQATPVTVHPSSDASASLSASPQPTVTQPDQPTATTQPNVGRIADVTAAGEGAILKLETGFRAGTKDASFIAAAKSLQASGARVELVTKAPRDPKYAPTILEINPIVDGAAQ